MTEMGTHVEMQTKSGKDRLIVALDVPLHEKAIELVKQLDNVLFFKIGLELILAGNILELMKEVQQTRSGHGGIFLDLKVAGDIGNTITRFVNVCSTYRIQFITLGVPASSEIESGVISTAVRARDGSEYPKILGVPLLSSARPEARTLRAYEVSSVTDLILKNGRSLIAAGCDGLIVSGDAIQACRKDFTDKHIDTLIVSPGIRPLGNRSDDHERWTTPSQAIQWGADYLVVGRPILNAPDRKKAAGTIIDEIDEALTLKRSPASM